MVNIDSSSVNRLSLGKFVTIHGSRSEIDSLKVAKIGVQKVSPKKFIGSREVSQQIVYITDEKSQTIYILGSFSSRSGEGLGNKRNATISLRYIQNNYDDVMEELLEQTPAIKNNRKGKKIVFIRNEESLKQAFTSLNLTTIITRSTEYITGEIKTQVAETLEA